MLHIHENKFSCISSEEICVNLKIKDIDLHKHLSNEYKYKRYSEEYSKCYHHHWNMILISLLPKDYKSRILDFGCGIGVLLQSLDKLYESSFGVDISQDMLKCAQIECKNSNLLEGDGEQLPFLSETWDAIVCRGALHHIPSTEKAIEEIYRILMPEGRFVISEPCIDSTLIRLIRTKSYKNSNKFSETHKAFTSEYLIKTLQKSGFKVTKVKYFGYLAYPLCGFPDFIPLLNYIPFSTQLCKLLILFDKLLSYAPIIKNGSWQIIIVAEKLHDSEISIL